MLSKSPQVAAAVTILPSNGEGAYFYDEKVYSVANAVRYLSLAVAALSLILCALGLPNSKTIGLETMAVVQISFVSLMALPTLNPSFAALTDIWFVNGFNIFAFDKSSLYSSEVPSQLKGVSMFGHFSQNYNITVLTIFLPLLIGLVTTIVAKTILRGKP